MKEYLPYFAMALIAALEAYAIYEGLNGTLLSTVVAIIAGLGGYQVAKKQEEKAKSKD